MKKVYEGERSNSVRNPFNGSVIGQHVELKVVELENILDKIWGSQVPLKIKDTPHFKYLMGDKQPLIDYFESCRGHTWARAGTPNENMTVEELLNEFEDLISSDKDYLEPPYESHYIIVRNNWNCIDGLRRACVLLSNGVEEAPVAWVN